MARTRHRTPGMVGVLAVLAAVGCQGPRVPHPLTNQSRYTCCNLHYEKPDITDVNFQQGTLLPLGTRVQIVEVRRNRVTFQADGRPAISLTFKYGKDPLTFDQYLERIFVAENPQLRLRKMPAARQKAIQQGTVEKGMTRDQVLMTLGYPPAHRTPSLEQADWHYWQNRWRQFVVFFDGDRVDRVQE